MDADEFLQAMNNDPLLQGSIVHGVVDLVGYQSSCVFDDSAHVVMRGKNISL